MQDRADVLRDSHLLQCNHIGHHAGQSEFEEEGGGRPRDLDSD